MCNLHVRMTYQTYTKHEADTSTYLHHLLQWHVPVAMVSEAQRWSGSTLSRMLHFKLDSEFHFLMTWQNIGIYIGDITPLPPFTNISFRQFTKFRPSQTNSAEVLSLNDFQRQSLTSPYQYCLVTFSHMFDRKSIAKIEISSNKISI